MANAYEDVVSRLASESDAVGRLAQNSGGFAAVIAAFESKDTDAFRWVLDRLEMLPYCELICEWVRIKLCVLRCIDLCGYPRFDAPTATLDQFARAVARLAENEDGLRRIADAVGCGNRDEYTALLDEYNLAEYCGVICHWVCGIGYRRVCDVVCGQDSVAAADPVAELRATGKFVAGLLANERAWAEISKAAHQSNCEILRDAINAVGFTGGCEVICRLVCFWRCYRVCRELCVVREPVDIGVYGIEEARSFALAFRKLTAQPRALAEIAAAVQESNREAYSELVTRFGLAPYCLQICAWICGVSCREFCSCVCPPPELDPWFTSVGNFDIYSDIDPVTGLTNKALPTTPSLVYGGGPNFAFFEQLQLGGFCPVYSPTVAGAQMHYRFLFSNVKTTLAAAINSLQTSIVVAGGAPPPPTPFPISVCDSGSTGETMTVTTVAGSTWTVLRGQDGTTAAPASAGSTLWVNPTPITGSLVAPVQVGKRIIPWPKEVAGLATAVTGSAIQNLYVYAAPYPAPPDPIPPAPGDLYQGPSAHYIAADPVAGWIEVDPLTIGGGYQVLLSFDTTQTGAAPGGDPLPGAAVAIGTPGGVPAGSPVPPASRQVGVDMTIIFQATRITASTVDFSNSLCKIHVNNWSEVNNLWFVQFTAGAGCCQPINDSLDVQFTVDHETMVAGRWDLAITSCSPSAPNTITPPDPTPGVTFTAGGRGASGTIHEDTTNWTNCSYTASLSTRPGLTTGLADRTAIDNLLTFCICGH